jgi:hypothetical protein
MGGILVEAHKPIVEKGSLGEPVLDGQLESNARP